MKFYTNFWFLKDKKVMQPGKILIFGKNPEISLKVRLFGVAKKIFSIDTGFQIVVRDEGKVSMSDFDGLNLFQS